MADTPTEGGRLPQHKVIAFGQNVTFVGWLCPLGTNWTLQGLGGR